MEQISVLPIAGDTEKGIIFSLDRSGISLSKEIEFQPGIAGKEMFSGNHPM